MNTQLTLRFFDLSFMQENTKPKMLLEVVREVIRLRHLSYNTEKHYLHWIRRYFASDGMVEADRALVRIGRNSLLIAG